MGEEAVAAGVCAHLTDEDIITSTHRGHGHALAKGCSTERTMAELYGRSDGYSGGRGGSMHVYAMQHGLLGTNGVVGGGIPLAVGSALSMKTLGKPNVSVAFYGDGASNHGLCYESLNLAAVYKLPVVFVCENNLYATATRLVDVASNPDIASRSDAFRMPGVVVDGNDVLAVYEVAGNAIYRARAGEGPTLIEAKTYRTCGHYEGDQIAGTYRTLEEIEKWKKRCPISTYRLKLISEFEIDEDTLNGIEAKIGEEIDRAVEFSRQSPHPDTETVGDHIFAEAS